MSDFCELIIIPIYFDTHALTLWHTHTLQFGAIAYDPCTYPCFFIFFFLCVCRQNHTWTSFYGDSQMDCSSVSGPCLLQGSVQPCPQAWNKTRLIWFSSPSTGDVSQCQIGIRSSQLHNIKKCTKPVHTIQVYKQWYSNWKTNLHWHIPHPHWTKKPSSITQIIAVSHECIPQTGGQAVSSQN